MTEQPKKYIEDTESGLQNADDVLTDEELTAGGLVPVTTFARTKASKNALRVKKSKARKAAGEGGRVPVKQLNLQAPASDDGRAALKKFNDQLLKHDASPAKLEAQMQLGSYVQSEMGPSATVDMLKDAVERGPRLQVDVDDLRSQLTAAHNAKDRIIAELDASEDQHRKTKAELAAVIEDVKAPIQFSERVQSILDAGGIRARLIRRLLQL